MTAIHFYDHPFAGVAPRVFDAPNVGQWLREHYPNGIDHDITVHRGEPSEATDITEDIDALLAGDAPMYTVLQNPGATAAAAWQAFQILFVAYSVASALMASKPTMPTNVNRTSSSPNNALGERGNQLRMLQRVEDIYGTVKSIPSLMMPTYNKYLDNVKYEYGYYSVGRGYYAISQETVKDGDTPIMGITGASAALYNPFTSPNSGHSPFLQIGPSIIDRIVSVRRGVEVDGITLKAMNQLQLPALDGYALLPAGPEQTIVLGRPVPASTHDRIVQYQVHPNLNAVTAAGQTVTITVGNLVKSFTGAVEASLTGFKHNGDPDAPGSFVDIRPGDTVTISGFTHLGNNGTFTVVTSTDNTVAVAETSGLSEEYNLDIPVTVAMTFMRASYSGTRTVQEVGNGWVILADAVWPSQYMDASSPGEPQNITVVANNGLTDWTDWVTISTPDRTEVWVNVLAVNGMYKDNGGRSRATVYYELQLQQLNGGLIPIGGLVSASGMLTGSTTDECAETLEYASAWTGPTRVRMRRTTPYDYAFEGTVIDEIKWADLYGVSPVTKADFGNKTTVHTVTRATPRATAQKSRELTCIATRKLPIYSGGSFSGTFDEAGRHVSGTIAPTSRMIDILAAVTIDPRIGRRPITDLDLVQIAGVQATLDAWNPECAQFNFTLDTDTMRYEDTVQLIADAVFCESYRQNGRIRLALSKPQPISVQQITHRMKKPKSEVIERTFSNDSDFDGVELVYADPITEKSEVIHLPLDRSARKAKKVEIAGIRNFAQAWYRACRELARIRYQRSTLETQVTTDARMLLPNSRIDNVDYTRFKTYGGDVVGQSGLTVKLNQSVVFKPGEPHSIVFTRRDGSMQAIVCTPGPDAHRVVLQALPSEALVTSDSEAGIATMYSFGSDSARGAMAWLVTEINSPSDGFMKIRAINYDPRYWAGDTEPVPPREAVINS